MARMIGFLKGVPDVDIALVKLPAALGIRDAARGGPSRLRQRQERQSGEKMPPRVHARFPLSKLFLVRILPNPRNPRSSNRDHERGRKDNPCVTSHCRQSSTVAFARQPRDRLPVRKRNLCRRAPQVAPPEADIASATP